MSDAVDVIERVKRRDLTTAGKRATIDEFLKDSKKELLVYSDVGRAEPGASPPTFSFFHPPPRPYMLSAIVFVYVEHL